MITKLKIVTSKFLESAVDILTQAVSKHSATGKTADSIYSVLKDSDDGINAKIYARGFFSVLEQGRRPTSKKPSPEMIANHEEYAKARGMDDPKKAAWAIATKINKEGDKTFQAGGREVYSKELDEKVEEYTGEVGKVFSDFVVDELKSILKKK